MKLIALLLFATVFSAADCLRPSPVGCWRIAHHGNYPNGTYQRIELSETEKERILIIDRSQNFMIVQGNDTVETGVWKLNKKGTKFTLKYSFSSTSASKSSLTRPTRICFGDSIKVTEDLPGREYVDQDFPESTYYRISD